VNAASFTADGKTILTAAADGQVRRWQSDSEIDGSGKTKDEVLKGARQEITRLATVPGFAITISADGRARRYDLEKKDDPFGLPSLDGRLDALAVDATGKRALIGAADGTVRLIELEKGDTLLECVVSPGLR
jgi:WD40 repeat protein